MEIDKLTAQKDSNVPVELPRDDAVRGKFFNVTEVRKGLTKWQNPVNKFTVLRLHYSADPRKRTAKWKENARAGMTWAEWMREYEIVWSSFEGVPVYGDDFSRSFHVSEKPLEYSNRHPMVRGWDFGLGKGGMACVFGQLLSHERLFVYREITATDMDIEHFAPEVRRLSNEWFGECDEWFDVIDSSGFNRSQIDKSRSCGAVINEVLRTRCQPGLKSIIERRRSVTGFLKSNVKGLPSFVIDAEGCPMLVSGFEGGYHFGFAKDGQVKDEPEKNIYSHPHDALQMIASKAKKLNRAAQSDASMIHVPSYGFGRVSAGRSNESRRI